MDENEAIEEQATATPIFSVYRRGYDPEQVDRYVADQQRRLDDALHRASESERKLAAAVGQLRELHRRVAVYESEARTQQPAQLDTLGERVQRILQEAWEGAYNLRQEAEREVNDMREGVSREVAELRAQVQREVDEAREVATREAAEVVDEATRRALYIREETERRRQAYLERVELDRERAIGQITYLYDQRQAAIAELARLQATVEATIAEMVHSPLGRPAPGVAGAGGRSVEPNRPLTIHGIIEAEDEEDIGLEDSAGAGAAAELDMPIGDYEDEPTLLGASLDLEGGDLEAADLEATDLQGDDLQAGDLGAADLQAADFEEGELDGAAGITISGRADELDQIDQIDDDEDEAAELRGLQQGPQYGPQHGPQHGMLFEGLPASDFDSPADIPTGPMERIEPPSFVAEGARVRPSGIFDAEQGGYT